MGGAVAIPGPGPIVIDPRAGEGAKAGGKAGGLLGVAAKILEAASKDAVRTSEEARTGRCSDGSKWGKTDDCQSCHPKNGQIVSVNRGLDAGRTDDWVAYQLKVANYKAAPRRFVKSAYSLDEWVYKGVEFDGFWELQCMLVEAKANYSSILKMHEKMYERNNEKHTLYKFAVQAKRQLIAAQPLPPAKLAWYFMQNDVASTTGMHFVNEGLIVPCIYFP